SMKRPRLKSVQALKGRKLDLTFINDQRFVLDMNADIQNFPGLRPLRIEDAFMQAEIGDDGWTVEWVDLDIQIALAHEGWLSSTREAAALPESSICKNA
nr:hypothetical protein [Tanacetum cinerariifolium]